MKLLGFILGFILGFGSGFFGSLDKKYSSKPRAKTYKLK